MNPEILQLEPQNLWKHFSELNSIPRPSKKEERVIQFMLDFGNSNGFNTTKDAIGNVLIKKPATSGMENRKTIVMQSHLDMVCQKNNDTVFDFDNEGIKMIIDEGFVKAQGTTLGADNGIGVATIMAILLSKDIPHPAIEAFFTIDEETGMTGAKELQAGFLSGDIMLNLDTEEDDELDIGCAGGIDVTGTQNYSPQKTSDGFTSFQLTVKGLKGGHSGIDIHKGRANANKTLARFLTEISDTIELNSAEGGSLRNAIPREANACFSVSKELKNAVLEAINSLKEEILEEFKTLEKNITITCEETSFQSEKLPQNTQNQFIKTLQSLHNGVYKWSPDIPDLVEASNNVARIEAKNGEITLMCLTRSSVESSKWEVAKTLQSAMQLGNFEVEFAGDYPGWKPKADSEILTIMEALYTQMFGEKPKVVACHAGLECGLIGSKYPKMEMISFGPNIFGAHSPDERVEIKSVQKFWKFLVETLQNIPLK